MKTLSAAAVLAGGRSTRFGGDKPRAPWKGGTLMDASVRALRPLFADVMVCAKRPAGPLPAGTRFVRERSRVFHPLAGLAAALGESEWIFLRGADMPFLSPSLVRALWRARLRSDAVIPLWKNRPEPLCGFYHRRTLAAARRALRRGAGLRTFLRDVRVRFVPEAAVRRSDPRGRSFLDADTPKELALLRRKTFS